MARRLAQLVVPVILTAISAVVLAFAKVSAPSTATQPEAALASGSSSRRRRHVFTHVELLDVEIERD